jgi:putative tricarboxylic transport membrane protein
MRWPTGAAARDSFSAIVIVIVCIIGMVQTTEYPARAASWPMWMWGLLGALSAVLLFNSLRQAYRPAKPKAPSDSDGGEAEPGPLSMRMGLRIAINIGLIIVYVILVPILGFFAATGLFLCVSMFYLGIRPAWKILAVTTGTLVVFYSVFEAFLGVLVPHGLVF